MASRNRVLRRSREIDEVTNARVSPKTRAMLQAHSKAKKRGE